MNCPKCGGALIVLDVRNDSKIINSTRRRRVCKSCEYRFTTYELDEEEFRRFKTTLNRYEKIRNVVLEMEGML